MKTDPPNRLRAFLQLKKMTTGQFAEAVGCSQSFVSEILSGTKPPSLKLAHQIELFTQATVPMNWWLSADGPIAARSRDA